ncbi:glucosamine-6-phosphate isomerases/6-phosphogluconolactonase-domain-containing protein [Blastocladiella britannica]|nr:glucosamine-6-phosphate isomerases/6-phosphogluconolactonase-domain-containing protein [Blastocladiella britannica]
MSTTTALATPTVYVAQSPQDVDARLSVRLAALYRSWSSTNKHTTNANEKFVVALSGGSLPSVLGRAAALSPLADLAAEDWSKFTWTFADERCVALDHVDSNYAACKKALFDFLPGPAPTVVAINPALVHDSTKAAQEYASRAPKHVDVALLGMGPDGHTCSLFPGHPLMDSSASAEMYVAIDDSPKPPQSRITLSLHAVQHKVRAAVVYVATGASKATVMKKILVEDVKSGLPAAAAVPVKESGATAEWIVDAPAVADVPADVLAGFAVSAKL